jgi:gamma-glutamyltranspeptidase/glutathione hydrolase
VSGQNAVDGEGGRLPTPPAPVARGLRGAVVSPHHLATEVGLSVLRAGGTAVDAAVATNAALSVVASSMCGLGGDAFWLIWDGTALHGLNGSGRSARGATLESAEAAGLRTMPVRGPWTVTVPGAVRSWSDAHGRFGRLSWADLVAPAVELAAGFPASPRWCETVERAAALHGVDSDWARVFRPHGRPWRPGEPVVLAPLARTLQEIVADGADGFYTGRLARRAARYLEERGSPLRAVDFVEHRSDWTEPIRTTYRGVTVTSHPPNSCGPVALELLNVLQGFEPPPAGAFIIDGVREPRWVHLGLEAARLTLADREAYLTDPDAMAQGALELLLDTGHAAALGRQIDPERARWARAAALLAGGGTVYLAAADRWGSVVSLIESNYAGFGSGLVDPSTGIAYQNRGAFFSLDPAHPNVLAPGKRTMHTLTPGMLFRGGRPWIAHGSMGGEIQPQIFAQFVSGVVDGRQGIAEAIAAPRWAADVEEHHGPPSRTVLEPRFAPAVADGLLGRGHRVEWAEPYDSRMGHAHAIELVTLDPSRPEPSPPASRGDEAPARSFVAATDPRSDGLPGAY